MLTFRTFEELKEHINFASKYVKDTLKIRENGHQKAFRCHTYEIRLTQILNKTN
ncbi:MAG: hypothetical protein IPJ09_13160 [Saprospiraceae bacterium]|nr:hypothetical protein [Saprospiraceae bacterium]